MGSIDLPPKPTKAQLELLRWMVAVEDGAGTMVRMTWRGGSLIDYYKDRDLAKALGHYERRGVDPPSWLGSGWTAGSAKSHAWRRAGGTALKNLAGRGFVTFIGFSIGVPEYVLNDVGRDAAEHWHIER